MIPAKVLEQHIAILGKTGSGKSYTAKGMAERLLRAKQRVCVLDPTDGWWGLRSDTTGKKPAFPIVVFGGEHGDCPLGQQHGAAIAEIIGTTDTPAVLSTRLMTVGERTRFFTDFAEALLRKNAGPLHLIIDEAHVFMPQGRVADPQSGKMLHAGNNLVSLGRGIGLRITLITQRPAKLHKDSLSCAETLIAMRLIAPQDRAAVEAWMCEWADPKQGKEILSSLPSLKTGDGWIWSPEMGILERMHFPEITTYDSSRAPDGSTAKVVLANIDLPTIQARLETVAHDAFENDPKRLRARIAELERAARAVPAPVEAAPTVIEKPVLTEGQISSLVLAVDRLGLCGESIRDQMSEATQYLADVSKPVIDAIQSLRTPPPLRPVARPKDTRSISAFSRGDATPKIQAGHAARNGDSTIGGGLRRMLIALAQRNGLSAKQLGVRAQLSSSSGTFGTYLGKGRAEGWLEGERDSIRITQAGVNALGHYEPLPSGKGLLEYWLGELGGGAKAMLDQLAAVYPKSLTAEELGRRADLSHTSGTFGTYLGKLRTLELINGGRDALRASDEFFD